MARPHITSTKGRINITHIRPSKANLRCAALSYLAGCTLSSFLNVICELPNNLMLQHLSILTSCLRVQKPHACVPKSHVVCLSSVAPALAYHLLLKPHHLQQSGIKA